MRNPFAFLTEGTRLAERAVDNAEYWRRELEKVEAERDYWRDLCYSLQATREEAS